MTAHARIEVIFETLADYEAVSIHSVPGMVTINLAPGIDLKFPGRDADHHVDLLCNRVRFELGGQVVTREAKAAEEAGQ